MNLLTVSKRLIKDINGIYSSDKILIQHLGLKSILTYRDFFINTGFEKNLSKDKLDKIIYFLTVKLFLEQDIRPKLFTIGELFQQEIDSTKDNRKKIEYILAQNKELHELFSQIKSTDSNYTPNSNSALSEIYYQLSYDGYYNKGLTYNLSPKIKSIQKVITEFGLEDIYKSVEHTNYLEDVKIGAKAIISIIMQSIIKQNHYLIPNFIITDKNGFYLISKPNQKNNLKKSDDIINETLYSIWQGKNTDYLDEIFSILKEPMVRHNNIQFVSLLNGKYHWINTQKKGWSKFLTGFYYVLVKKKWVQDNKSAPSIAKILTNTFNFDKGIDSKNFRNISIFNNEDYTNAFNFIKENTY